MLSTLLRRCPKLLVFSLLASIPTFCVGDEFDDMISEKISELGLRGVAITVFDKNTMMEPITRGYGKVSSSASSSDVTADTAFMIASISKPFVASAVAVMVDNSIISIDDDVCDVIPENISRQACRNPNHPSQKITWKMLMTHRSSMKGDLPYVKNESGDWVSPGFGPSGSFYTDFEDTGNPSCPLDEVVDFYRALLTDDPDAETTVGAGVKLQNGEDLNWYELGMSDDGIWENYAPGEQYEYSNAAYGYLTALIELATDQSFPDFCRENLFDPLGMDTTAWFLEELPAGTLSAVPVDVGGNGSFEDIGQFCFIDYGSGSLRTTVNDLARWGDAMLEYGAPTLWSSETGSDVVACQEPDCEFGYGWILLDNSFKGRRRRNLNVKERRSRKLDEFDATLHPSSEMSFSDSTEDSTENSTEDSFEDSTEDSTEDSSSSSTISPSSSSSEGGSWSAVEGLEQYDWTDGIMHDGADAGVQTSMIILPKAGFYVAVLLNTNDGGFEAEDLTATIIDAISPGRLSGNTIEFQLSSSSPSWKSVSLSSVLALFSAGLVFAM